MNCDVNVWDRLGYETDYKEEGWSLSVYSIPETGAQYGSGEFLLELELTEEEAKALTLGVNPSEGGDYASDSDFWIDIESFFVTYQNVPPRVEGFLKDVYMSKEV